MAEQPQDEAIRSTDEPVGDDHTEGRLVLTYARGRLMVYRIRDFRDAADRGEGAFE